VTHTAILDPPEVVAARRAELLAAVAGPSRPAHPRPACGTRAGAQSHRRHDEPVDAACRQALVDYSRDYTRTRRILRAAGRQTAVTKR
jgi:hypothetical protein